MRTILQDFTEEVAFEQNPGGRSEGDGYRKLPEMASKQKEPYVQRSRAPAFDLPVRPGGGQVDGAGADRDEKVIQKRLQWSRPEDRLVWAWGKG